jgi:Flp pilus assembly protein TadD
MNETPGWFEKLALPTLILAGAIAYCNCFTKAFVFDDHVWITGNPQLKDPSALPQLTLAGRPLITISLWLNYRLGGLEPFGYHLFNLIVHLLAGLTLYGIVRRTLQLAHWPQHYRDSAGGLAFTVALLWLVHPLQTQSVTYIIQRCESVMGLFFLQAVYFSLRAWDSPWWWLWGGLAVATSFLSAACKEVAVAIPLLVVLYDWTFLSGSPGVLLRRRWALYAGLTLGSWICFSLGHLGGGEEASVIGFRVPGLTPLTYLLSEAGVLVHYLKLSLWPSELALDYIGWPIASSVHDWLWPGLLIAALLLATFWGLWNRAWYGFVGAWFFVILAPTSSFIPIQDLVFEHRLYLSLAAVVVVVVLAGDWLLRSLGQRLHWTKTAERRISALVVVVVAGLLMFRTLARNEDYRSADQVWAANVRVRPGCVRAWSNWSNELANRGATEEALEKTAEVVRLTPSGSPFRLTRARVLLLHGDTREAAEDFRTWIDQVSPAQVAHRCGFAQALLLLGNQADAEVQLRKAIALDPHDVRPYPLLALVVAAHGDSEEAEHLRQEALRLDPEQTVSFQRTARRQAMTQAEAKEPKQAFKDEAVLLARVACLLSRQQDPDCLDALAIALATSGRYPEAVTAARNALELARKAGDRSRVAAIELRLRLFEAQKPYTRETARQLAGLSPDAP